MDPLSVAASITGLLSAANKITQALISLSDAPRLARSVSAETTALSAIFSQLNNFLRYSTQRMSMTTVEQFVTVLTHCVLTFAELEQEIDGLMCLGDNSTTSMALWDRVKWTARQETVKELLADLQMQKASLNLMIAIWSCKTNIEAARKYEQLCTSITAISQRSRRSASINRNSKHFSLTVDTKSRRSSHMSVVSLDQVKDISSLTLPLYSCEIYNHRQYITIAPSRRASRRLSWGGQRPRSISLVAMVAMVTSLWKPVSNNRGSIEISGPFDMKHNTHIGVNPETGKMEVFGQESPETVVVRKIGLMA